MISCKRGTFKGDGPRCKRADPRRQFKAFTQLQLRIWGRDMAYFLKAVFKAKKTDRAVWRRDTNVAGTRASGTAPPTHAILDEKGAAERRRGYFKRASTRQNETRPLAPESADAVFERHRAGWAEPRALSDHRVHVTSEALASIGTRPSHSTLSHGSTPRSCKRHHWGDARRLRFRDEKGQYRRNGRRRVWDRRASA